MHKQYHLDEYPIPKGFRIYQDRVPVMGVATRRADVAAFCKGSDRKLAFLEEPENRHDPNAIRIVGSWKGWLFRKEKLLGYVPAEEAAKLARLGLADSVLPRLLKTYVGTDGFVEIEIQIIGPIDLYRTFNPLPPTKVATPAEQEAALARLKALAAFLMNAPILNEQQRERLSKARSGETVTRMLETDESYGQASDGPDFLSLPESDFHAYLQSIDNDLSAQLDIVDVACRSYFKNGEIPAPYYPWRIAVILRKRKMKEQERDFLEAWCRHFASGNGVTYGELVKRAERLGVGDNSE
jgi:HIRAN domain